MISWCEYCHTPIYDEDIRYHRDKKGWVHKHHGETRIVSDRAVLVHDAPNTFRLFGPPYRFVWEMWQQLYPEMKQELVLT